LYKCALIFFYIYRFADTLLWRGLSGVHLPPKSAHKRLLAHFNSQEQRVSAQSASDTAKGGLAAPMVTICLVDELDYLLTRDFSVMYDFYSWPQTSAVPFIMIGIANTMDLPERLSNRYIQFVCNVLVLNPCIFSFQLLQIDVHGQSFTDRKTSKTSHFTLPFSHIS